MTDNYVYDEIGNMVKDSSEKITGIRWTVYGKIRDIYREATALNTTTHIRYDYDAQGNRIGSLRERSDGNKAYTWYVRDAQGNVMSTYAASGTGSNLGTDYGLGRTEVYTYGSSRLGMFNYEMGVDGGPADVAYFNSFGYLRGWRQYELTNHLGNACPSVALRRRVLTTISDKKIAVASDTNSSLIGYFNPDIVSAQDYYPFGMPMRVQPAASGRNYRFGFNGQEMDNDIKGWGNSYGAQYWEYDSRVGRRWNLDPVVKDDETPYSVFHNNPIMFNDPFGDDPPKKPGALVRFWRGLNNEYYKTRAENYANEHNIDEKNIIDVGKDTWVVINDNKADDVQFSVFRKSKLSETISTQVWSYTSPKNDDYNLTAQQFVNVQVQGNTVIDAPIPGGGAFNGITLMGAKGNSAIVGIVNRTTKVLENYKKIIRFGVSGHPDVLNKGFHLHFDDIVKNLELGLRPTNKGIGLVQVGKKVGTAIDIKNAVNLFNQAMNSSRFRAELLVRLKATQEYMQEAFKFTKDSQQAIDKAHELNYLIKTVEKF